MAKNILLDHWRFLAKRNYRIPREADLSRFTASELRIIRKYGTWMEALENQILVPITQAQMRFLSVCRGTGKPSAEFAVAWMKLKQARQARPNAATRSDARSAEATSSRVWTVCPSCSGSGHTVSSCETCQGTGWLDDSTVKYAAA